MFGLLLLLALETPSTGSQTDPQTLLALGNGGQEAQWSSGLYEPRPAATLGQGARGMVLPLMTRSERVTRAYLEDGRVVLSYSAGVATSLKDWRAGWIRHRTDQRVVATAEGFHLVGPALLPTRVLGCDPELLFRQDGFGVPAGEVQEATAPPGAKALVAIPVENGLAAVRGTQEPLALGSLGVVDQLLFVAEQPVQPELHSVVGLGACLFPTPKRSGFADAVDQATFTAPQESMEIAAGQTLVLALAEPAEHGEEETWSLVVSYEVSFAAEEAAVEASSPVEPVPQLLVEADLDRTFLHQEGAALQIDIRPTMGPGAAWGDVNGDGAMDLYLVQGAGREGGPALSNRLLLGLGDGSFRDATEAAGVGDTGAGMGALFFDVEGDGDLDLFVANYGKDVLYQNDGSGQFQDVSEQAGFALDLWSASAAAADYDGDGDLDLYVTGYLDYDTEKMPPAAELDRYQRDDPIEMLPFAFPGERNALYRNESGEGGIRFVEVAEELGVSNPEGLSMQALWWDFDRDGDQDLYVANDVSFNVLYRNDGGTFTDITFAVGLDDPRGGMGLVSGDVDRDGDEDLVLTNWELETNALYLNNAVAARSGRTRRARFHDGTVAAGLGPGGIGKTSWSPVLFDMDLDGDLDLYVANGYTSPDYQSTGICIGQSDQVYRNNGRGRFADASEAARSVVESAFVSRAAVPCDYDRDGDIDLLVTANNGPATLLAGTAADRDLGAWIGIRLRSGGKNPFGVGAEVTIHGPEGTKPLRRSVRAGSGYLGGTPPELHFGLGRWEGARAEVEVRWPDGEVTREEVELGAWRTLTRD